MVTTRLLLTVATILVAIPSTAFGERHAFIGVHPRDNGGLCYIDDAHFHAYAPEQRDVLYRDHDGHALFIGDPVAYGYDGDRHTYYGHHPISVDVVLGDHALADHGTEYCYLTGAHFHAWAPPATAKFELKGDAYWYVGTLPETYERPKKKLIAVNAVYEPIEYTRPVVVVEPPRAWVGVSVHVGAGAHGWVDTGWGHGHYEYGHEHKHYKYKRHKYKGHKRYKYKGHKYKGHKRYKYEGHKRHKRKGYEYRSQKRHRSYKRKGHRSHKRGFKWKKSGRKHRR